MVATIQLICTILPVGDRWLVPQSVGGTDWTSYEGDSQSPGFKRFVVNVL